METFCTTSRHSKYRPTLNSTSFYQASNYSRNFRQNDYGFANSARNSALLWHERPHPAATKSKGKLCSIALAAAAFIVLIAVLSIAGLALYMGALKSEPTNPLATYSCSAKVLRGDRFISNLAEKARRYRLQFESLYQRSTIGPSLVSCSVERFGNDSATIHFRVILNRRKIPRHIYNVEKNLKDILLGDGLSRKPVMRNVRFDPRSVSIKLVADSETYQRVITKPKDLPKPRPSITQKPSIKPNISQTDLPIKKKANAEEIDIKEDDLPVIQGSFKISKTEADITEKKINQASSDVSTQKPKITTTTKIPKRATLKETSVTSALFKLASAEKTTTETTTLQTTTPPTTTPPTTNPTSIITNTKSSVNPVIFSVSPSVFNQEPWVPIYHLPDETGIGPKIPQVNYEQEPKAPQLNYNLQPKSPQLTYSHQGTFDHLPMLQQPSSDQHSQLSYTPQITYDAQIPSQIPEVQAIPSQNSFNQNQQPIYTSFTNPGLSFHSFDAEKLGSTSLRGHPIPVNKIAEVTAPSIWNTTPNKYYNSGEVESATQHTTETVLKHSEDAGDLYDLQTSDNNYDSPGFVEVETLKYVPAVLTPNNTTENTVEASNLENDTLHSVNATESTNFKVKQSAVLKNISSIFHSLASSLGIASTRLKLNQSESSPITESFTINTSPIPETKTKVSIVGQGQAEVVDVDELSLMMQTTKVPLVTLLPVKSNSGVGRPIRPRPTTQNISLSENRSFPSDAAKINLNLNDFSRNPVKYIETEVVTSVSSEQHKIKMNKSNLDDYKIVSVLNFETELPNVDAPTPAPLIGSEIERDVKIMEYKTKSTTIPSFIIEDQMAVIDINSSLSDHKKEDFQYLTPEKLKQLSEISILSDNSTHNDDDGVISTKAVSSSYTINHAGFKILTKTFNKIPNSLKEEEKKGTYNSFYLDIGNKSDCSNFTVKCGDGQCLPDTTRCNQLVDCNDGSDEKNCNCADYLRSQFLLRKICDGIVDCWDFSDENNCEWCKPGQYVCGNSKVCIDQSSICDGIRNCPHGDDERQCVTVAPTLNAADEFPYHSEGYLMVRKHGKWGKLCVDNFEAVVAKSKTSWEISDLGQAVCKAMTYQSLDNVKTLVENKLKNFYKNSQYYELTYSFQNETKSSLTFENTTCGSGEVVRVKCQSLECGARPQATKQIARVVGGGNAGLGAWPWQAALYKEGEFQCGATLISDKWLLSAGHCFFHSLEEHWVARLGALRRGTALPSPYEQLRPIVQIILHPGYVDAGFINDISLLKMEVPVIFSDYVRPICLPLAGTGPRDGRICTVVGWGQLFEIGRIFPDTLQEVQIPVISTTECRKRTLFLPLYRVTDDMFCAGYDRGGRDACLGDSGGPLMCPETDGRWVLHGITSNGYGCARAYRPGVYTKVSNYITWINSYMYNSNNSTINVRDNCIGHRCPLGECLPKSRLCNGFIECSDGSDEVGCLSK